MHCMCRVGGGCVYHVREVGYWPRVVLPRLLLHLKCDGRRLALRIACACPPGSDVGVTWSALNACGSDPVSV